MKKILHSERYMYPVRFRAAEQLLRDMNLAAFYQSPLEKRLQPERRIALGLALRQWLAPVFPNLNDFPHLYFTDGITGGLNAWMASEVRPVQVFQGEYAYISHLRPVQKISQLEELKRDSVLKISQPFSANGNFDEHWAAALEEKIPLVLDAAYVGTTAPRAISTPACVEKIFYSFSKTLGLSGLRTGFLFSREPHSALAELEKAAYHNYVAEEVALRAMQLGSVGHWYEKMAPVQLEICEEFGLTPSHSFLTATCKDESYQHLKREDGTHRINLSAELTRRCDFLI